MTRTPAHARPHRRRGWLIAGGATLGALLLIALAGLPLYVLPPADDVTEADVIYVIGPPTETRLAEAERLRDEGVADRILVSVPLEGAQSASAQDICDQPYAECRHPLPFTTKGEAMMLRKYAAEHDVDDAVVITFTPHVARTRYIFGRCFGEGVAVVAVEPGLAVWQWAYQYAYQTAAFAKAWLTPCSDTSEL